MPDRYAAMFARCATCGDGALIPFVMLGDPDVGTTARTLRSLVEAGADALELGIPFSDPVADGPVLQAAAVRALAAGIRPGTCLDLVREVRRDAPDVPIGLLTYANTVLQQGIDAFYTAAAHAGVDSVLVVDAPLMEGEPFERAAHASGIAPVFIAPPDASRKTLRAVAGRSRGYTYVTSRPGITGASGFDRHAEVQQRVASLAAAGAPPPVIGFGIATPADVVQALSTGARGAIVGSALVDRLHRDPDTAPAFVGSLKDATRGALVEATRYLPSFAS